MFSGGRNHTRLEVDWTLISKQLFPSKRLIVVILLVKSVPLESVGSFDEVAVCKLRFVI